MKNVAKKGIINEINLKKIHFIFNNFFPENRAVYEIMWKNIVDPDRPLMTVCRMHCACWTPKATNTHS